MPVTRLNHAVLYVRDVERSVAFYRDILGFSQVMGFPGAAFLQAPGSTNDHDLGLFEIGAGAGPSPAGRATVGLYHLAWEVDTLAALRDLAAKLSTPVPWPVRRTTPPPRASTPRTPTGSSSRWPESSRPTASTTTSWPAGPASSRSTWTARSSATAPGCAAASASRSRSET